MQYHFNFTPPSLISTEKSFVHQTSDAQSGKKTFIWAGNIQFLKIDNNRPLSQFENLQLHCQPNCLSKQQYNSRQVFV